MFIGFLVMYFVIEEFLLLKPPVLAKIGADCRQRQQDSAPFSIASTIIMAGVGAHQCGCMHNLSPVILVLLLQTSNGWKAE